MTYSSALSTELAGALAQHLLRKDGQEDLTFAVYFPSRGASRTTGIIHHALWPEDGDRNVHGNASFESQYFLRALFEAADAGGGLAFVHSHPEGHGWQGMSADDIDAETSIARQVMSTTGLPLLGLTLAGDGTFCARFWEIEKAGPQKVWCESVRLVGDRIAVSRPSAPIAGITQSLDRTVSAWGSEVQGELGQVHIGIVGAGSVGALVGEALVRMGVRRVTLIDFDTVKDVNLDRLLHAYPIDARLGRTKVAVLQKALIRSAVAPDPELTAIEASVVEEAGYRAALDCDVLFSCVDRPWGRFALNMAAYAHLIPVIDGGIKVRTRGGKALLGAEWKAHLVGPTRRCLECLGQYDPGFVTLEREGHLDDPHYIEGLPRDHPLRARENVFPFSMSTASFEVLQMLSAIVVPLGIGDVGALTYHFVTGELDCEKRGCEETCLYSGFLLASGESNSIPVTGAHPVANAARAENDALGGVRRAGLLLLERAQKFIEGFMDRLSRPKTKFVAPRDYREGLRKEGN